MCKQLAEKLTRTMTEARGRETKRSPHCEGLRHCQHTGDDDSPEAWLRASQSVFRGDAVGSYPFPSPSVQVPGVGT